MADTYILQEDLPDAKAGDRYVWNGAAYSNDTRASLTLSRGWVEVHADWFKKEEKERIEVDIRESVFNDIRHSVNNKGFFYEYTLCVYHRPMPKEKAVAIKKAIEQVLNDDSVFNEDKINTQLDKLKAMEYAFTAARLLPLKPGGIVTGLDTRHFSYPTFQDYLNSLND